MRRPLLAIIATLALMLSLAPLAVSAGAADDAEIFGDVEVLEHHEFRGGAEIDFDGRYAYVAQASVGEDLQRMNVMSEDAQGGVRVIDLEGGFDPVTEETFEQFEQVGFLDCPGTDNYLRMLDPDVYTIHGDEHEQYLVMAFHGNACTRDLLLGDPNTSGGHGALNGIAVIDVTDRTDPKIIEESVIGHVSAHTVMPHPTRPYFYILPGGTANGTSASRLAPTAIIDATDLTDLRYVNAYEHNAQGCHDLGWTNDGEYAYCAGLGEVQVWDVSGDNIEDPVIVNTIVNPAIQFAHNAVVSPDGQYMLVNDEAFGFHTCQGVAADLYGSLWIYDISIPDVPVLAGRIAPPTHPDEGHLFGTLSNTPVQYGWAQSWCAAHNYNFVPGTNIVVASWFAGGVTAHDISDPLSPELIAGYKPADGVMWSGHYYGGYVLTGDMALGTEILDMPALRDAEAAAAADGAVTDATSGDALGITGTAAALAPRKDMTDVLIPKVLPERPVRPTGEPGFCVIPAS